MSDSQRIYVDIDDVLCETADALRAVIARDFGRKVPFERIHSFNIGVSFDLTPEQVEQVMDTLHTPGFLRGLQVMQGALDVLTQWAASGYEITVVTGRPPSCYEDSEAWLIEHAIPYSSLVFVDKYSRTPAEQAAHKCLSLKDFKKERFCLAVEDSADMTSVLVGEMGILTALFARPWNAHAAALAGSTRCHGWADIASRFPNPGAAGTIRPDQ